VGVAALEDQRDGAREVVYGDVTTWIPSFATTADTLVTCYRLYYFTSHCEKLQNSNSRAEK
jgi:hypothetical protein